jgi:hypothetical protein
MLSDLLPQGTATRGVGIDHPLAATNPSIQPIHPVKTAGMLETAGTVNPATFIYVDKHCATPLCNTGNPSCSWLQGLKAVLSRAARSEQLSPSVTHPVLQQQGSSCMPANAHPTEAC